MSKTVKLAILIGMVMALMTTQVAAIPTKQATGTCGKGAFNIDQALSDQAQRNTLAFDGLAMITGNLEAQSFFPPGKMADYWGFQYLRDNDPDNMGHNTSFLTRAACNVLFTLDSNQVNTLKQLAKSQVGPINEYGYRRYPLMKAFRRLIDSDLPAGSTGLSREAVKAASKALYELDGQISFERAVVFAEIFRSLTPTQKSYLDAMVGKGWNSWPNKTQNDIRDKTAGLSRDESVALMTYAGDIYSWYAGCVAADVYFCPERHGTYFGGFYIKDAPAVGRPGYSIDEELTATAGSALCDSSKGYVTREQAALMSQLVTAQRNNLFAGTSNIVQVRTDISSALRSLITSTTPTAEFLAQVKATVLEKSGEYGELDGENNYFYATAFFQMYASLSASQVEKMMALRKSILSGTYADGTPFDFTVCTTPYLFSGVISSPSVLEPYISNTDYLFQVSGIPVASFSFAPGIPAVGQPIAFQDTSTGGPTSWTWDFGDGTTSMDQNPSHAYATPGSYTISLIVANAQGTDSASGRLKVMSACTITGVSLSRSPFSLNIDGTNFQPECQVLLNGQPVPTTLYQNSTLVLARGSGLKERLPKGVSVQIVVQNPDGAMSEPFAFTRQ